jgi:hypothetical protein
MVLQGTAETAVHTLQTGWCFYAGLDAAKRSNVWLASQSPAALAMLAGALCGAPGSGRPPPLPTHTSESLMQVSAA